jgi:hypothetical protein
MIEKFIVGYYYRFIKKDKETNSTSWNPDGKMDLVLDGKWHRCINSKARNSRIYMLIYFKKKLI